MSVNGSAHRNAAGGALLALLCACSGGGGGSSAPQQNVLQAPGATPSVAREREAGFKADSDIRAKLRAQGRLIDDPLALGFLNDLGQSLVRHLEPQPFVYRFRIVKDPSLNAFALPGGAIYFNSGTILEANDLDELAGVMAHEIAHSKRHHWMRRQKATALPSLVTQIVGIGLAAATGDVAPLVVAEGVNQALRLKHTREFEEEADTVGTAFMVRAGYDPLGMAVFFDRLNSGKDRPGYTLPPYLYSHPRSEVRALDAVERARSTTIPGSVDPKVRNGFRPAQLRLALLVDQGRTTLQPNLPAPNRALADASLNEARRLAESGDGLAAAAVLQSAERREPNDPRLPFRRGELLAAAGHSADAIAAYRRALELDPNTALAHYRLALALKELGERGDAVFHLEQAQGRLNRQGALLHSVEAELLRLIFPVVRRAGLVAGGQDIRNIPTLVQRSREQFDADAGRVVWWAEIEPQWKERRSEIEVRWIDPGGAVVAQGKVAHDSSNYTFAALDPPPGGEARRLGIWQAEAVLDGERIVRKAFRITPPE